MSASQVHRGYLLLGNTLPGGVGRNQIRRIPLGSLGLDNEQPTSHATRQVLRLGMIPAAHTDVWLPRTRSLASQLHTSMQPLTACSCVSSSGFPSVWCIQLPSYAGKLVQGEAWRRGSMSGCSLSQALRWGGVESSKTDPMLQMDRAQRENQIRFQNRKWVSGCKVMTPQSGRSVGRSGVPRGFAQVRAKFCS
mgnify:CR=1 FL=1